MSGMMSDAVNEKVQRLARDLCNASDDLLYAMTKHQVATKSAALREYLREMGAVVEREAHQPREDVTIAVANLLAVIHGDGGHYQHKHGESKAANDAEEIVIKLRTEFDSAQYRLKIMHADALALAEAVLDEPSFGGIGPSETQYGWHKRICELARKVAGR